MENPNSNNPELQYERSQWYHKIALWDLSDEQKSEIAQKIITDVSTGVEYWSLMFLSAIIASLGLLINSTPVVIGAMIIAPIIRPIQAVSFATTNGNRSLFLKSIWLLFASIVGGITCAVVITTIIPFSQVTNEIAMRTQPTLIDLFIAFASGIVAFLAFAYKNVSNTLAGVAMAAALLPPLCVIGIGIAFGSRAISWGSTLLFLTNLVAIIIAGIGMFYLFGFFPNARGSFRTSMINSISAMIMLAILCVPLGSSLVSITRDLIVKDTISQTTTDFFNQLHEDIELQTMEYDKIPGGKAISLTLKVPQNELQNITHDDRQALTEQLSQELGENIELDVTLVPITSVYTKEMIKPTPQEQLQQTTQSFVSTLYRNVYLLQVDYSVNQKKIVISTFYTEEKFDKDQFEIKYKDYIKERHPDIDIVVVNRETEATEEVPMSEHQKNVQSLSTSFSSFFPQSTLHKLTLQETEKSRNIAIWTSTPYSPDQFTTQMQLRKIQLEELYTQQITIETHITYMEQQSF